MKKNLLTIIVLTLLSVTFLTACTRQGEALYLEGEEYDKTAASIEPIAENIMKGIETNDYDLFAASFDESMRTAITPDTFAKIADQYAKLGTPGEIELLNIEDQGDYYSANFGVSYEKVKTTMRVVVKKSAPELVSGLWFK